MDNICDDNNIFLMLFLIRELNTKMHDACGVDMSKNTGDEATFY